MKSLPLLLLAIFGLAELTSAQTNTWTNATGGDWDVTANWDPNSSPNASGAVARITNFTAAGSYTVSASTAQTNTVGTLTFGTTNTANNVTNILAANAGLRFQTTSGDAALNLFTAGGSSSAMTIQAPITLATNLVISLTRSGGQQISPTFSGDIDLGSYELRFGTTRVAGINMFSKMVGTGKLVFNGPGSDRSVVFTNTNSTFSGGVNLDAAGNVLQLGNTNTFSGNATNGLLGTGSINFNSTSDNLGNPSSPRLQANGAFFPDRNDSTNNVLANAIVISNGRFGIIDTTRGLNTTGDISGSGKFYKITGSSSGDRAWAINNANTNFSGTVELRDGQVFTRVTDALGSNSTFIFASQSGVNGVALAGPNTNGASVKLGSALVFSNTTNQVYIQASGGSTFELSGNFSNAGSGTAGSINFSRGDGVLTTNGGGFQIGNNSGVAAFILSGTGSLSNRVALVNVGAATASLVLSNTSGTQTFSGEIARDGSVARMGVGGATVFAASNSYTGTTTLGGGTLRGGNDSAFGTNTLILSNGTLASDSATARVWSNNVNLAGNATLGEAAIGTGDLTFAGVLSGIGSLTKDGPGTVTLNRTNTYTGSSVVSAGTLSVATNGALTFVIGGNGTNNGVSGVGSFNADGRFIFNLAGAATNNGASWTIVANALTETYGTNFLVNGFSGSGGNWTNNTNGVDYVFQQATGILTVGAPVTNNYAGWVSYWTNAVPGFTNTAATDNPDGDPFINNMEFAFDGNPAVGSPALLTAVKSGTNTVFNYVALTNPSAATYVVQFTGNLTNGWTNSSVTISNSTNQGGLNIPADYTRKEFVVPATGNSFYRVQATIAP